MNVRSIRFRLTAWYSGLLAGVLLLFCGSVYFGLRHYLERSLEDSLVKQTRQIGEQHLALVGEMGEAYVVEELNEHYAPELNNRFVRITRANGNVLYVSGPPRDQSFDTSRLPLLTGSSRQEFSRDENLPTGKLLVHTLPFVARDGSGFRIETGAPYGPIENVLQGLLLTLAIGLPVMVATAMGGGYLLMRRALKPVDEITRRAESITSRNLCERLPVAQTGDELERLSKSLNRMIARLEESFQYIKRFSADVSHELRTPLTIIRGELESIVQRSQVVPDVRETIGSVLEEVERLTRIVENLLTLTRLDVGEARMEVARVDLGDLALITADQLRLLAEDKRISLQCDIQRRPEVQGDPVRLKQVVVNLLDNAIKYTPGGGIVRLVVTANNGSAVLEVIDNGVGIPAAALPHIFDRFYRVDKARTHDLGGAGLGLSIVKAICSAHGGEVSVESTEGQGTCFRVELPLAGSD